MCQPDAGEDGYGPGAPAPAFAPVNMTARVVRRSVGICAMLLVACCCAAIVYTKLRQPRLIAVVVRAPGAATINGAALGLTDDTAWIIDRVEVYQQPGSSTREYHLYLGGRLDRVIVAEPSAAAGE